MKFLKRYFKKSQSTLPVLGASTAGSAAPFIFYSLLFAFFILLDYTQIPESQSRKILIFAGGLLMWTLLEYFAHRGFCYLSSKHPNIHQWLGRFRKNYGISVADSRRFFVPPVVDLLCAAVLTAISFAVLNGQCYIFMAGLTLGFIFFSYVHFRLHTKPGKLFSHHLWLHHVKHHHKYPDKAFGVSSPLWDIVFGTMPPSEDKSTRQLT